LKPIGFDYLDIGTWVLLMPREDISLEGNIQVISYGATVVAKNYVNSFSK